MADSVNVQHKLQMLFETKLDEKSRQQVGKQIKGMLENAVISFDEAEARHNLESIIKMMNKLFSKAEMEGFDSEKLLKMPSQQALQEIASRTTEDFQKAFDQALKKSGGIKIDFGTADMSAMTEPLNQLAKDLTKISDKIASSTEKSVSEIEESLSRLGTDKKISKATQNIEKLLTQKIKVPKDTNDAISKLVDLRNAYGTSKADNDSWEVQYQHLLRYVRAYEVAQQKFGESLTADNPQLKDLYEMLSPKAKTVKISLENFVDMARGNELAEDRNKPWAREKTLQEVKNVLQNGITVNGKLDGGSDIGDNPPSNSNPEESPKPEPKPKQNKKVTVASSLDKFVREYDTRLDELGDASIEEFIKLRNEMISKLSEAFKLKSTVNNDDLLKHFELYELNGNEKGLKTYLQEQIEAPISKATKSVAETTKKTIETTKKDSAKKTGETSNKTPSSTVAIDETSLKGVLEGITYKVKVEGEENKDASEDNQITQVLGEISQKIDVLSRDETLQGIKSTIDTALVKKDTPTNNKISPEEKAEISGNREQRFEQLANIASMYEEVDDVEAAIQEFGKLYKEIILIGEESTKAIKPNKAGINTLKKIATGDIDLGFDYSWVEFKRNNPATSVDAKSSNASVVSIDETALANLLNNITYNVNVVKDDDTNKTAIDETSLENILSRVTYNAKIIQDADAPDSEKAALIDTEALKTMLNAITYNVKIVYDDADKTANKIALDDTALESTLTRVFANILNPKPVEGNESPYSAMPRDEATKYIDDHYDHKVWDNWYSKALDPFRTQIAQTLENDVKLRNAALNQMWDEYKHLTGSDVSFEDFLNTKIPLYRGEPSDSKSQSEKALSFSLTPKTAEEFGENVLKVWLRPADTLGMANPTYVHQPEAEVLVPKELVPEYGKWRDSFQSSQSAVANNAPWAREDTLGAVKGVLDNIQANTAKIGTAEAQQTVTIDTNSVSTISSDLTAIRTAVEAINGKVVGGTVPSAQNSAGPSGQTAKKNSTADTVSEKKVVSELINLYQQLGQAEARRDMIAPNVAEAVIADDEVIAINKLIEAKLKLIDVNEELGNKFADSWFKGVEQETKKPIQDLGKQYEELGRLRAKIDTTPNGEYSEYLQKQLETQEKLVAIESRRLGISPEKQESFDIRADEAYYAERTRLAEKAAKEEEATNKKIRADAIKQQLKDQEKALKQQIKANEEEARMSKARSTAGKAIDSITNIGLFDDLSKETKESVVKGLYDKLADFNALRTRIQNGDDSITEDDIIAFRNLQVEIDNTSREMNELIALHNLVANGSATAIANNVKFDPTNMESYRKALENAIQTHYRGKAIIGDFDNKTGRLNFTVKSGRHEVTEYKAAWDQLGKTFVSIPGKTKKVEGVIQKILKKAQEFGAYFTGSSIIYKAWNAILKGIQYVREIDSALTELKKVTDETEESYERFLNTASKTADRVGSTIKEIVSSTADWARIGYSMEEAYRLAESTAILLNVSEFQSIDEATSALTSTLQAFSYTAEQSMYVVDILNEVGNNFAVSSDGLATALKDSASSLVAANNSYEEAIALIASANRVVQDPSSVGAALRTISLRLRGTSTKELEEAGEDTTGAVESKSKLRTKIKGYTGIDILTDSGAYKSTYEILLEISKVWDDLTDSDRAGLLELIAGG